MKSQKGIGLLQLVLIIVVLMLLVGVTTYVVFQDNGIVDREEQKAIQTIESDNQEIVNEEKPE